MTPGAVVVVRRGVHADPHGVPDALHYAGVTQTAKSVEEMFAHKMFSKFRTVKKAFNMVSRAAARPEASRVWLRVCACAG